MDYGGFWRSKYLYKISDFKEVVKNSVTTFYDLENSDLLEKY